jgi:hypothetical protein
LKLKNTCNDRAAREVAVHSSVGAETSAGGGSISAELLSLPLRRGRDKDGASTATESIEKGI